MPLQLLPKVAQGSGLQVSEQTANIPATSTGKFAQWALNHPTNPQALLLAAHAGNTDVVTELLRRGANPNAGACSAERCTKPLTAAVFGGNVEVVKALLAAHAEVDTRGDPRYPQRTALTDAAATGNANIVRVLIANGATVNAKDSNR